MSCRHRSTIRYAATKAMVLGVIVFSFTAQAAPETTAAPTHTLSVAEATAARAKRLAELMDSQRLFARGARRVYEGESLTAISLCLGGIAAGPIQINGQGQRHIWQIVKNCDNVPLPNSFFAVRVKPAKGPAVVRAVQTTNEGPFQAMRSLTFSGEYPFGWYTFADPALPATISLECFSPLIPLNEKDSSIPCAIFNLTAENKSPEPIEVSFLAAQRNAVGMNAMEIARGPGTHGRSWSTNSAYGGNVNRIVQDDQATILHMTTTKPKDAPVYGDMALAALTKDAVAIAAWTDPKALAALFAESGKVSGSATAGPTPTQEPVDDALGAISVLTGAPLPTPAAKTLDGALAVPFVLAPGQKRTVTFVLAWHFPNVQPPLAHRGNMYSNWWPDAISVARDVTARFNELSANTHLYNEALYASNLPYWLLDRLSSQVAILSSMTCSWGADGFFYGWEGCNEDEGCCDGNATHVWGYAQAHARLFPAIGRAMRDADAGNVKPEGMLPVRFGLAVAFPAFDGQCAFIMSSYREHLTSADRKWLDSRWPTIKRAMDYTIARWDAAGTPSRIESQQGGIPDGMLTGPQHAMDGDQGGTCSWLGSMYLGALAAAAKMAIIENDPASAARYKQILAAGMKNQDKALFNGEYYIQVPDETPRQDYLTGCYIDQLLGQWWAFQIDCGWLYPPAHVRSAMKALVDYNFRPDCHGFAQAPRQFVADDDAGMQQLTWSKGGKPAPPNVIQYGNEIMSGFEYSAAALMINAGLMKEAFMVLRAAADRYDGRLRKGLSKGLYTCWGYSGNPFGDDECGKFYARSMSIWSVLLACQGFAYDGPAGRISFDPKWQPENHASFFTVAEGWGVFVQKRAPGKQSELLDIRYGQLALKELVFATKYPVKPSEADVQVKIAGKIVGNTLLSIGQASDEAWQVNITFSKRIVVPKGQQIEVFIRQP